MLELFHGECALAFGRATLQHAEQRQRTALEQGGTPAADGFGGSRETFAPRLEFDPGVLEPAREEFVSWGVRAVADDLEDLEVIEDDPAASA
jgi:hypothetical protein